MDTMLLQNARTDMVYLTCMVMCGNGVMTALIETLI
jgi:hypothetical protein